METNQVLNLSYSCSNYILLPCTLASLKFVVRDFDCGLLQHLEENIVTKLKVLWKARLIFTSQVALLMVERKEHQSEISSCRLESL